MSTQPDQFLWKIGAPAGYGIMTTGLSMSMIATRSGMQIYDYTEYPSLIQGGHNTYEVLISKERVTATKQPIDLLVCLAPETYSLHQYRLHDKSLVLYDPAVQDIDTDATKVAVPLQQLLNDLKASKIMINMVALGASIALMDGSLEVITDLIHQQFAKKKPEIAEMNTACATAGFNYVKEHYTDDIVPILAEETAKAPAKPPIVMDGNTAFSMGAVAADCRFYAAYPMSPSSSVLENLAGWQHKTSMVVRHAEDEIGVVNEALGASFAGVRSAVGTSGGGFALMAETISYAGIAEQPLVVFVAQRPGPATGMPTWTEQGDLLFAVHTGHGEFPKIVLAPGDVEEMLELAPKAFNLAEIYQTPVIVLSEKVLSESHLSIPQEDFSKFLETHSVDRGKTIETTELPYARYQDSADGISPRLIPGFPGVYYQSNSYEHIPDSHTTEEAEERILQVDKRARKTLTYFEDHYEGPRVYGELASAETVLVGWGGTKGPLQAAQKALTQQGHATAIIHFNHVFPLHADKIKPYFEHDARYLLVENNSTAQFGQLLRMHTGINIDDTLLKYDGRPIFMEEIIETVLGK